MSTRSGKTTSGRSWADRPWPWLFVGVVLSLAAVTIAYAGLHAVWTVDGSSARAAYVLAVGLGAAAIVGLAITGAYALRRRAWQERSRGSLRAWLHAHVAIGIVVAVVVGAHVGSVPVVWSAWTAGTSALVGMTALVASGVAWRIVYRAVPLRVARAVSNLSPEQLTRDEAHLRTEVEMLAAGRGAPFLARANAIIQGMPLVNTGQTQRLDLNDAAALVRVEQLGRQLAALRQRARQQSRLHWLLQGWRVAHVPLAIATTVAIAWHVASVSLRAGEAPSTALDQVADFPPSAACGRCHQAIHGQWLNAAHGRTQLKPVVIAQTNMFVAQLGRAKGLRHTAGQGVANAALICNNCHAPVAAQVTGRAELPIDPAFGRPDHRHPVLDDGVTCVVCHAPHEAPREASGVADGFFRQLMLDGALRPADLGYGGRVYAGHSGARTGVPFHDVGSGFMTDASTTSRMCGACHSVHMDLDGVVPPADDLKADLVLQQTFTEWQDSDRDGGQGCTSCHMTRETGRVAEVAPPLRPSVPRAYAGHTFHVPIEGAAQVAVAVAVDSTAVDGPLLMADVTVTNQQGGHKFPTGFRFAREFWLEVSAETDDGTAVCLAPEPVTGAASPCVSGHVERLDADLAVCDVPQTLAALAAAGKRPRLQDLPYPAIELAAGRPLSACDPWLTTFRPHLTDGDPDRDGTFREVAYQSLGAGIVKDPLRVADGQPVGAIAPDTGRTFRYAFDVRAVSGTDITVNATLHYRRFAPHFLRALEAPTNYFPAGSSASAELVQLEFMTVDSSRSAPLHVPK